MRVPGFSAEWALRQKSAIYEGIGIGGTAKSQSIVPQIWRCTGNTCCNVWTGQCMRCNPWGWCWPISRYQAATW